jgi:hypothetical protein
MKCPGNPRKERPGPDVFLIAKAKPVIKFIPQNFWFFSSEYPPHTLKPQSLRPGGNSFVKKKITFFERVASLPDHDTALRFRGGARY